MSTDSGGNHRYPALDALRGAAAFAVLFYHYRNLQVFDRPAGAASLFASGYLAVDFFFVLSGFVIAHAYSHRLQGSMSAARFMIRRFVRLQPVLAIGTLTGLLAAIAQRLAGHGGPAGFIAIALTLPFNLAMLPGPFGTHGLFLLNPPAWSVFYEMVANAVYAAGLRWHVRRRSGTRMIGRISGIVCCLGLIGVIASIHDKGGLDHGVVLNDWPVAIARIAFSFPLGILLFLHRDRWMPRVKRISLVWLLPACLVSLAPDLSDRSRAIYDLAFVAGWSPVLVMLGAMAAPPHAMRGFAGWLGMVSYPLYAVHAPIKHLAELFPSFGFLPLLVIATLAATAFAWLIGVAVDPPLQRWLSVRNPVLVHSDAPSFAGFRRAPLHICRDAGLKGRPMPSPFAPDRAPPLAPPTRIADAKALGRVFRRRNGASCSKEDAAFVRNRRIVGIQHAKALGLNMAVIMTSAVLQDMGKPCVDMAALASEPGKFPAAAFTSVDHDHHRMEPAKPALAAAARQLSAQVRHRPFDTWLEASRPRAGGNVPPHQNAASRQR